MKMNTIPICHSEPVQYSEPTKNLSFAEVFCLTNAGLQNQTLVNQSGIKNTIIAQLQ